LDWLGRDWICLAELGAAADARAGLESAPRRLGSARDDASPIAVRANFVAFDA
jgi:hypothetical protein